MTIATEGSARPIRIQLLISLIKPTLGLNNLHLSFLISFALPQPPLLVGTQASRSSSQ
jgi:hypothetical protein